MNDLDEQDLAALWSGRKGQEYSRRTLERYGTTCHLCGLPGANSADHVIPKSVRPDLTFDLDNLRPAHDTCNSSKGKRIIEGPAAIIEDNRGFFKL